MTNLIIIEEAHSKTYTSIGMGATPLDEQKIWKYNI